MMKPRNSEGTKFALSNLRIFTLFFAIAFVLIIFSSQLTYLAQPSPGTYSQRSCQDSGNPQDWNGISVIRERNSAWLDGVSSITDAFELFSIRDSFENYVAYNKVGYAPYVRTFPSPLRQQNSNGLASGVQPDGLRDVNVNFVLVDITTGQEVGEANFIFPDYLFYEAKTTRGTLNPPDGSGGSSTQKSWQMGGFIDALNGYSNFLWINFITGLAPAGLVPAEGKPNPAFVLVSPSSSLIGQDLIDQASRDNVELFRSVSCDTPNGQDGKDELQMGAPIRLRDVSDWKERLEIGRPATIVRP